MKMDLFSFLWELFNILAELSQQLWNFITYTITIGNINIQIYQILGTGTIVSILVIGIVKKLIVG